MNRSTLRAVLVAICLGSLAISACGRAEPPTPSSSAPPEAPQPGGSPAAKAHAIGTASAEGRMVMSEATISLRTARPDAEADAIGRFTADNGGYVVSRDAQRSDGVVKSVEMTLRIPSPKFESTLGELRHHGTVMRESVSGQDVTDEYTDTEAELKSKRRLEERLLHIVEASTTVKDTLEVESELTRVRTDIERLEGHARLLENRVSLATIHASLLSPDQPGVGESESVASRFANAFREAGSMFTHVAAGMVVVFGALLPIALPAAVLLAVVRRRRRLAPLKAAE